MLHQKHKTLITDVRKRCNCELKIVSQQFRLGQRFKNFIPEICKRLQTSLSPASKWFKKQLRKKLQGKQQSTMQNKQTQANLSSRSTPTEVWSKLFRLRHVMTAKPSRHAFTGLKGQWPRIAVTFLAASPLVHLAIFAVRYAIRNGS